MGRPVMSEGFTPGSYVRDRGYQLAIGVACLALLAALLAKLGFGADATLFVTGSIALCLTAMLLIGYLRRMRFYRDMVDLSISMDGAYSMTSLLEEPDFLEGRLTWQALDTAARWAADEAVQAQAQTKAYRDFVELWIHEIKTPIAAATLMAANLHGPLAAKLKGELDRIEAHVEQALYVARSTSLAHDYTICEIGLSQVMREACKKNARYLIERNVTPVIDIDDDLIVFADVAWLVFIVGQVMVNAAKYGASTVRFSTRTENVHTAHACTVLELADDGIGIPPSDVPRVFDRGFTGINGRAQGSATGMGLYLVATLCEKMGLGVGLASEVGTGTRVLISFPHDRRRQDACALAELR